MSLYVLVLVTLSSSAPCQPAHAATPDCKDTVERMDATSLAMCEIYAAWWREHARKIETETADRFNAVCVEEPKK